MSLWDSIAHAAGSLGSDAVSSTVGLVVGAAIGSGRSVLSVRIPARRIWRYKSESDFVIIVSTSGIADTGVYHRAMTGLGQVRALTILSPSLRRAYPRIDLQKVLLSEEVGGSDLDKNLLVIGGPKSNAVSKVLLEKLSPIVPFTVSDTTISLYGTQCDAVSVSGQVTRDYGYAIRAAHPLYPSRRVVLIGGTHTYGTASAARWLVEKGRSFRVPGDVAVVVESEVVMQGHVSSPKVIYQGELK